MNIYSILLLAFLLTRSDDTIRQDFYSLLGKHMNVVINIYNHAFSLQNEVLKLSSLIDQHFQGSTKTAEMMKNIY